jgi:succinate dehydrogenase hydrophobic anchor subunit
MGVFEAMGLAWVVFCTVLMTVAVLGFAYIGARSIASDAKAGMQNRKAFDKIFSERVER